MTKRFAVLDSNMVILLTVGMVDPTLVARHKRTRAYNQADFEELLNLVEVSKGAILCPNVASEAHNLVAHSRTVTDQRFSDALSRIILSSEERLVSAKEAVSRPEYSHLGVTDTTLLMVARNDGVLVTGDALLHVAALGAGLESVNLFHIKEQREGL